MIGAPIVRTHPIASLNSVWPLGLHLLLPRPTHVAAEPRAYLGVDLPGDLPDALEPLEELLHPVRGELHRRVTLLLGLQDEDEGLLVFPMWGFHLVRE